MIFANWMSQRLCAKKRMFFTTAKHLTVDLLVTVHCTCSALNYLIIRIISWSMALCCFVVKVLLIKHFCRFKLHNDKSLQWLINVNLRFSGITDMLSLSQDNLLEDIWENEYILVRLVIVTYATRIWSFCFEETELGLILEREVSLQQLDVNDFNDTLPVVTTYCTGS